MVFGLFLGFVFEFEGRNFNIIGFYWIFLFLFVAGCFIILEFLLDWICIFIFFPK